MILITQHFATECKIHTSTPINMPFSTARLETHHNHRASKQLNVTIHCILLRLIAWISTRILIFIDRIFSSLIFERKYFMSKIVSFRVTNKESKKINELFLFIRVSSRPQLDLNSTFDIYCLSQ